MDLTVKAVLSVTKLGYTILISVSLLVACSRYPDYSDQPPAIEPVEIVREVPGYDFFWPMSIATDSGLVFIADFRDCHVKVFDHQLTLLDSIGGKGEGPGEFKAIIDISARHGILAALNIYPSRISIFDYQGNLLHDFPVEATRWGEVCVKDRNTIYLARYQQSSHYFVTELTTKGEVVGEFLEHPRNADFMASYTSRVRMHSAGDRLFLVYEQIPRITCHGRDAFDISHDMSSGYPGMKRNLRQREKIYRTRHGVLTMTVFGGFAVLPEHLVLAGLNHNLMVLDLNSHDLYLLRMGSLGSELTSQHQLTLMKRGSGLDMSRQGTDASRVNTYWDALTIGDETWMLSTMNSCLVKFKTADVLAAAERGVVMAPHDYVEER